MSMEKEIELSWLVQIGDFTGLNEASSFEHHLQFEYRLPKAEDGTRRGRVRVRKTTAGGQIHYLETIKAPRDPKSSIGDDEFSTEISQSYFEAWTRTFGNKGISKTRYNYTSKPVELKVGDKVILSGPMTIEVDVFMNQAGERFMYAKIDIEVQGLLEVLKAQNSGAEKLHFNVDFSTLPLKIGKVIDMTTEDEEERKSIDEFFAATNCISVE